MNEKNIGKCLTIGTCSIMGSSTQFTQFALAHYRALIKTIAQAPSYVFPSLVDDIHIMGPMNKITHTFDHLLTQLTLVGLRVKVLKCKLWSPLGFFPSIEIPHGCTLVRDGLSILGVPVGFQNFATHFLDGVLFQDMAHIDDLPLLGHVQVILGILSSCVIHRPYYLTQIVSPSSLMSFLTSFDRKVMQMCGGIMG